MQGVLGAHAGTQAREAGDAAYTLFTQSKLALNGLALAVAGFFGIFNVLKPQSAIISIYVAIFGLLLIAFGAGWNNELLVKYFGFIYKPGGQFVFLLLAGNLAWSVGLLGVLAAVFANLTAIAGWLATPDGRRVANVVPLPDWLTPPPGSNHPSYGPSPSTSVVTDYGVRRDELL